MPEPPTVAAVLADRSLLDAWPSDHLPELLLQLAAVQAEHASLQAAITARLVAGNGAHEHRQNGDRLLTAGDVAERLGMSKPWVYRTAHAGKLSFAKSTGPRSVRFSERGLEKYIAARGVGR